MTAMELSKSKSAIRKYVRSLVKEMSAKEKQLESDELRRRALSHRLLPDASVVALFVSLPDEPETRPLIKELSLTHTVVLPVIYGDEMEFYRYTPDEMHIGAYGIEEPSTRLQPVQPQEIDLMFVPGVAFTRRGARLGRGKGYYDKYMSHDSFVARCVGYCYDKQLVDDIPTEPHDIMMHEML